MAYISTIASAVASLGVLLGLISGIFLLVLTGLRWVSRVRAALYDEELRRQEMLQGDNPYLLGGDGSDFGETKGQNDIESRRTTYGSFDASSAQPQGSSNEKLHRDASAAVNWNDGREHKKTDITKDTVYVRELIEKLVETVIGSPLDGTTVGQLSTHSAYLTMFGKYHSLLCRELARLGFAIHLSVVHGEGSDFDSGTLRRLIKRIISEAMSLPNFKEISCRTKTSRKATDDDVENKSYEDILATAILNKVIENNEKANEVVDENPRPRIRSRYLMENEDDDGDQGLVTDSDSSDSSRSEKLSLTIEEFIEEVTTTFEISDDDICVLSDLEKPEHRRIPFPEFGGVLRDETDDEDCEVEEQSSAIELITSTNSWEENWLFQKKRLRSTPNVHHPVPVPMLVPKPSEDFRALVGGVDAEDLSDISDCSDLALEGLIEAEEKPPEHRDGFRQPSDADEGRESPGATAGAFPEVPPSGSAEAGDRGREPKGESGWEERPAKGTSLGLTSPEGLFQKDREYSVEDFQLVYQRESANSPISSQRNEMSSKSKEEARENIPRCRIAEREKEKWRKAVPLSENPYSPENIEKREQKNKIEYFRTGPYAPDCIDFPDDLSADETMPIPRFSRDYYVNAAKHPSGISSRSLNRFSRGFEQDLSTREVSSESFNEIQWRNTQHKNNKGSLKTEFRLPSVKELAKQFTTEGRNRAPTEESESKHKLVQNSTEKILRLPNTHKASPAKSTPKHEMFEPAGPATRMETRRIMKCDFHGAAAEVSSCRKEEVRFNGKQVHSLTARSISKEFREGLKKNSRPKAYGKVERSSSGGESDQGDVISNEENSSSALFLDLKNVKKFWEERIQASSPSPKQN